MEWVKYGHDYVSKDGLWRLQRARISKSVTLWNVMGPTSYALGATRLQGPGWVTVPAQQFVAQESTVAAAKRCADEAAQNVALTSHTRKS